MPDVHICCLVSLCRPWPGECWCSVLCGRHDLAAALLTCCSTFVDAGGNIKYWICSVGGFDSWRTLQPRGRDIACFYSNHSLGFCIPVSSREMPGAWWDGTKGTWSAAEDSGATAKFTSVKTVKACQGWQENSADVSSLTGDCWNFVVGLAVLLLQGEAHPCN